MKKIGLLKARFPLHRAHNLNPVRHDLLKNCKSYFWGIDTPQIRNYFGSKVAFYFAWLQFYLKWLVAPAFLGILALILKSVLRGHPAFADRLFNERDVVTFWYCLMIAMAAPLFTHYWTRVQNNLALEWGQNKAQQRELQSPWFRGVRMFDGVSGLTKKIDPRSRTKKALIWLCTRFISLLFVCLSAGIIAGLFTVSIINAIQIHLQNWIYGIVARKLTAWENTEFDSQWQDSLTFKLFMFQFVNSYASLIHIAFLKASWGTCHRNDCLAELDEQFICIFAVNFLRNGLELGRPIFWMKWNAFRERQKAKKNINHSVNHLQARVGNNKISNTELQSFKEQYESPLEDYMEIVIQYGYIVMFSASFPLAPFIALVIGIVEVRVDGYKLTDISRRPIPFGSSGIGNWLEILRFLGTIGVLSNATIIVFTSTMLKIDELEHKWFIWLIIVNGLFIIKMVIKYLIPEVPALHKQIIEWQTRIVDERLYNRHQHHNREKQRENTNLWMQGPDVAQTEFARDKISEVNRES